MAAFAAVGAVLALSEQRASVRRQMFVATFVGMMERLQSTVQDTDYLVVRQTSHGDSVEERIENIANGQGAFYEIAQELRLLMSENIRDDMATEAQEGVLVLLYPSFYDDFKNDLGHFFRQLYHIVKFIDESEENEAQRFLKIVRASLTNSQLLLLAYNVIAGEGRVKFAKHISKYSLLHNMDFEDDLLGKVEKHLIIKRLGKEALVSETHEKDRLEPLFIKRDQENAQAKDALKRYLIENGLNTDFGVSWRNPT